MKSNSDIFSGTGKVFGFTFKQIFKNKANIATLIMMVLFAAFYIPIVSAFSGGDISSSVCSASTVYISDNSGLDADFDSISQSNPSLAGTVFKKCSFSDSDYQENIDDTDVFVTISPITEELSYHVDTHITENSSLNDTDISAVTDAITEAMKSKVYANLGVSADELSSMMNPCSIDTYTVSEYNDSALDNWATSYTVQYIYSIIIMIITTLASSYIVRSVIDEKSSKLVELLMVSVRPLSLLFGKILAVLSYVLIMTLSMIAAFAASYFVSTSVFQSSAVSSAISAIGLNTAGLKLNGFTIAAVVISLALGILTFAIMSGLAGTCCTSMEDVGSANMYVMTMIMVVYILSFITPAINNSVLNTILSLLPVASIFYAPAQYISGNIGIAVLIISWVIQAVILVLLLRFTAKVYSYLLLFRGERIKPGKLLSISKSLRKEAE